VNYGTTLEKSAGRLVRVVDRDGALHATLTWGRSQLCQPSWVDSVETVPVQVRVRIDAESSDELVVEPAVGHPVLGRAHPVAVVRGGRRERVTACTAIDWTAPREIPAIAAPGALPAGVGTVLLNLIAIAAREAGVAALRYAGPYPTPALWAALATCFRTTGDRDAFIADAAGRALRLARDAVPIDFVPAPFERVWIPGGEVHLRDGIERVRVGGADFRAGGSPARLVASGDGVAAEVWFGDAPWARVAVLAADGRLVDGPHPVPTCTSAVVGQRFPAALRDALGELIAEMMVPVLASPARTVLADAEVRWADCGALAARAAGDAIEVHAALWERIAPLGLPRLAAALAEALAPVVARRAQAQLAAALAP
jgi:hypothetical protein